MVHQKPAIYLEVEEMRKEIESLRARLKEKDGALQELQNKLAEAEKDAERLEWMVFNSASVIHSRDGDFCRVVWVDDSGEGQMTKSYGTTYEAIDAAIQQAKRGEQS